jgi:hypothetical protein
MVEKVDGGSKVVFLLSLWMYFGFGILFGSVLRDILCGGVSLESMSVTGTMGRGWVDGGLVLNWYINWYDQGHEPHRRGGAPLSTAPSSQGIQEAKANSKHSMILETRRWLFIYCSPLIQQFHKKTPTERKLISSWKETNLKDPKKLGRKYLDSWPADLGLWHLFSPRKPVHP